MDVFLIKQQDAALLKLHSISDAKLTHLRCGLKNSYFKEQLCRRVASAKTFSVRLPTALYLNTSTYCEMPCSYVKLSSILK